MLKRLIPTFGLVALGVLGAFGCSDTTDPTTDLEDDGNGNGNGNQNGNGPDPAVTKKPVYAVSSVLFGPEGNTTYLSLLDSLDPQSIDYTKAIELSGWGDMWVHEGSVFVSDGESPTITKYSVSDTNQLVKQQTISFASRGVTDAAFWANTFVAKNKAYMLKGTGEYVVWNPETMELGGSIALPTLPEREGFVVRTGTTDRSNVVRDGKLYQPMYWGDDEWVRFAPDSKVAVIDIATDTLVDTIDVPCAALDIGSLDENGDLYFSTWTSGVVQPLLKETSGNCVAKIAKNANTATSAFTFAGISDGREGAAARYDGAGRILLPIFHHERATFSDASTLLEELGKPNWRLWSYDRATGKGAEIDSVEWNSGAVYVLPIAGKTHLLIPGDKYLTTKVVRLEGSTATPLFETRGWAMRLFKIR